MYKKRHIESIIPVIEKMYGAILVTGPRQVGKTTLLENYTKLVPVSLDDSTTRIIANEEPTTFLNSHKKPVLIDEIQKSPNLFSQIKYEIDKDRNKKALFYMTGSEKFQLMKGVSESLSGRIGILNLLGLSRREYYEINNVLPFISSNEYFEKIKYQIEHVSDDDLWHLIHRGSLPELLLNDDFRWDIYYSNYLNTYIERDIRSSIEESNLNKFNKFLINCAALCGEVLNLSSIAKNVGISQPTADRWLSKLCETNIVYLLKPYSNNVIKRVVKSPKLYFTDTGFASYLTKWNSPETLKNGAISGHIFENYIIMEIYKSYINNGISEPPFYYYRDNNGKEIDLIIEDGDTLYPIEIKQSADPKRSDIKNFNEIDNISDKKRGKGALVCRYDKLDMMTEKDYIVPVEYL